MGKVCECCGKPTEKYNLCFDCNKKKTEGLIVKNDEGKWVDVKNSNDKKCIICGKEAKFDLCISCFKQKQKIASELEGSTNSLDDTKDYYNNLKYNIFKLKNMDYARTACIKLLALGDCLVNTYSLKEYAEKAKNDAIDLLKRKEDFLSKNKKPQSDEIAPEVKTEDGNIIHEENTAKDEILDYRRVYPMNFRCKDGHYVRSKSEKMIDDYLYEKRIIHVYEKKVINEDNGEEYYPDYYLIINNGNTEINIYLEYFGLEDDEKYMATEKKKIAFYKSKGFNIIEVREKNTGNLEDYLDSEILKIRKKYKK